MAAWASSVEAQLFTRAVEHWKDAIPPEKLFFTIELPAGRGRLLLINPPCKLDSATTCILEEKRRVFLTGMGPIVLESQELVHGVPLVTACFVSQLSSVAGQNLAPAPMFAVISKFARPQDQCGEYRTTRGLYCSGTLAVNLEKHFRCFRSDPPRHDG